MTPFHGESETEGLASLKLTEGKSFDAPSVDGKVSQVRQLYFLAVVDESTGTPLRAATEEDLSRVPMKVLEPKFQTSGQVDSGVEGLSARPLNKTPTLQELLAIARMGNGPKCDHCFVTGALF